MSPYHLTIDEDLKRADEILAKGKADPPAIGGQGLEFIPEELWGHTICGGDISAAYMLLKSFVEHIRYLHQQAEAGERYTETLERFRRRAIKLNRSAARRIAALEAELAKQGKG